jgi:hypothetical protein
MKIEKIDYEITDGKITLDTNPDFKYVVLERLVKNTDSIYCKKEYTGVRFILELSKPSPAFFLGLADYIEDDDCTLIDDHLTIIFHERLNLIGAYFEVKK